MAKKQRFTQRPTVFEPSQEEIDAVLADVFEAMDKAEADRLAREAHALEMLAADAVGEDEQQPNSLSERAQVVEDAVREDIERQNDKKHCGGTRRRWRRIIDIDAPIPYTVVAYELTSKARTALEAGL